jgi:arylsulfatase A-like enzyme
MLCGILLALILLPLGTTADAAEQPNMVLILADDLGLANVNDIETPAIDRMAAEGLVFSNAYAGSALCAPSRAALLLGDHTGHVEPRGNIRMRLAHEETTLAEAMRETGYATGLFGKWGFGYQDDPSTWPERHGWDEYLAYLHHLDAQDHTPELLWQDGERRDLAGEYAPDLFDEAALAFIERHQDQPFLLYVASALPHAPLEVPGVEGDDEAIFAAMVRRLDQTVGAIVSKLEELGLAERTLVLVTSDNGATNVSGLRGEKGTLYEGGIRVPLVVRWPGTVDPDVSDALVAGWDIYATALAVAGGKVPSHGTSLLRPQDDRTLYWELHDVTTAQAVRWERWKALRHAPNEPIELYDLGADPLERNDLAHERPDLVAHARETMEGEHEPHPHWPLVQSNLATDLAWLKATVHRWLIDHGVE